MAVTTADRGRAAEVWADPDRLQQIFWNLLSNAVKFTSAGDRIEVSMQREGPEVWVRVRDTGAGIAPDFLPHVFERFRQGDGSPTRMHGGLGLGSVNRPPPRGAPRRPNAGGKRRRRAWGHLHGLSARPRGGKNAILVPPDRARARERPHESTWNHVHVLIVDDRADARELLRAMLTPTGARISEAGSAEQAHAGDRRRSARLLLADVAMPTP